MKTLRKGDRGSSVERLQQTLNTALSRGLRVDGHFGPNTEDAVIAFQERYGLIADGIVGPVTWAALGRPIPPKDTTWPDVRQRLGWQRVACTVVRDSYPHCTLREDVAEALEGVRTELTDVGGILTTSGARRSLSAAVSANRSATSLHYTGRAIDLFVGAGMSNPSTDAYVVSQDGAKYWQVWARAPGAPEQRLRGWVHAQQKATEVVGPFLNLTEIFRAHGFHRIARRRSYRATNYGASEWWHFQYETGLEAGKTRFGDELLRVYEHAELESSAPWRWRDSVWGVDWF